MPRHRKVLGERIRLYRKLTSFTQEQLAEKAQLAPSYISDVERGRENISVDALARIAKAVGIELEDFFCRDPRRAHNDGNGFSIQIEAVPLDGRITLRVASEAKA